MSTVNRENQIAVNLDDKQRRHYDELVAMTDAEFRDHLLSRPPSGATAMMVYTLDRIAGYRRVIDDLTAGVASNGVDVSDEAAEKISKAVTGIRATVLAEIARLGEATSDDVEATLDMKHQTCSTRFQELRKAGYVERCEAKRPTRAGNPAWPHRLTDDGWRKLRELQQQGHEGALNVMLPVRTDPATLPLDEDGAA